MEPNISPLTEYQEALLRFIQSDTPTRDEIDSEFSDTLDQHVVNASMVTLENLKYIKTQRVLAPGIYTPDTPARYEDDFGLTALGKNYLAKATANFTSFSNISNSNIAHQSPRTMQTIVINEQPQDIQEKIKELELAVLRKDGSAMAKAFGYIADKAVDVAIAYTTGALIK